MILSALLSAKAAAAVLGAGVLVVGGGAAAYAGVLPTALQTVAHDAIGAPAAGHGTDDATESPEPQDTASSTKAPDPAETQDAPDPAKTPAPATSPSAPGPDATGPAAFGLCTAHTHGGLPDHSTAGQALLTAAGAGGVDAYCATVLGTATPSAAPTTASPTQATTPSTHGKGHAKKHAKNTQHGRPASVPSH